jgi:hypothetical protein
MAVIFQIPDEAYDQLRTLLEHDGSIQWQVGDFITEFWTEMKRYLVESEVNKAHAKMIRDFADHTGADRTTLRDRERMSRFFTQEERAEYPILTFHQFRALRSAGDDWQQWAEWAMENGRQGAPASTSKIRQAIKESKDPTPDFLKRLERMEKDGQWVLSNEEPPKDVKDGVALVLTILEDTKEFYNGKD